MSTMELISLSKKVALITGASSGIGRATAVLFAKLGSRLALVARDEKRLQETLNECFKASGLTSSGGKEPFIYISADLSEVNQIEMAFKRAIEHFTQLDILVNDAGILIRDTVENLSPEVFERTMNLNLRAAVWMTHFAVPALIQSKGSIVNVSSVCGNRSFPGVMSYCVSKAALDQFTRCCALDLASKGVRVNSVNPGVIVTPLQRTGGMTEEEYAQFLERSKESHALGRPGNVDEVARAIAFLASSASSFTTGDLLTVDGGRSVMCPR